MAFSLTRPPSPIREGPAISTQGHDEDHLSSALHAALSSFVPGSLAHPDHHHEMIKDKEKAGIDIVVDSDTLSLKGTGVDVEPALLKGHVVLYLKEPTSIKEITLQFRGKAKLPTPSAETLPLGASPQWYTICNHEWSFLEGEKRHSHTLKAGIHHFPFQLQLGGSLPSSLTSNINGGAHVSYKLRAVAVRPGLAHNMQAIMPISILRTFAPEALEYQQSLEIENTWPEKLMYSIMIPHKAWAAGDKLTAIVKFSPLSKGVRVLTVVTTIQETTKLNCRGGLQEHTRCIVTAQYDVMNENSSPAIGIHGRSTTSGGLLNEDRLPSFGSLQDLSLRQVPSVASSSSLHDSPHHSSEPIASTSSALPAEEDIPLSQDDTVSQLTLFIPKYVTPSHPLEPISVSHRIRWSILMSNLDGHTSELRCSLPLHILDARLLDEARANSAATRRLLLGGSEAPIDEEHDAELPSYSAHVRDRVANMYLPDSATTRVLNPWVHSNVSPTYMPEQQSLSGPWLPSSGTMSPSHSLSHQASLHLPHAPHSGTSTPLEWVNSELLLSLSNTPPATLTSSSDPASQPESRLVSRRGSRAPSPDHHFSIPVPVSGSVPSSVPVPVPTSVSVSGSASTQETFVHDGHASRTLPGLFSIQLKPHASLTSPGWLSSRSNSLSNLNLAALGDGHRLSGSGSGPMQTYQAVRHPTAATVTATMGTSESLPESALWHRAFTEVPDYDVASRGFIGGVTPLTSMRGLPSYEEANRDEDQVTIERRRRERDV